VKQKKVIVLGSTGSIGKSTLDVAHKLTERIKIAGLSCYSSYKTLLKQAEEFNVQALAITKVKSSHSYKGSLFSGKEAASRLVESIDADIVLNGIAGSPGLLPSIKAIETKKNLALANKETIVMAGQLVKKMSNESNVQIIPVDSEHSALFHLLKHISIENVKEIILTASGGAFRDIPVEKLPYVTPKDALQHPTWKMGEKITIDSATMANKGLEVIEAVHLFDISADKIKVVIHPQSYVHSLVRTVDGNLYAQISLPDMRLPIQNALTFPDIVFSGYKALELTDITMTFSSWDKKKYPMLKLAYEAAMCLGPYPIVYNSSNEMAVAAFLKGLIRFTDIAKITARILEKEWKNYISSLEDILKLHNISREITEQEIRRLSI
jgi:1-deoxy-D-xylulose-5-phosphate reductoisomerase